MCNADLCTADLCTANSNIVGVRGIGASDLQSVPHARRSMYLVMEAMGGGCLKMVALHQMCSGSKSYKKSDALRWCIQVGARMSRCFFWCSLARAFAVVVVSVCFLLLEISCWHTLFVTASAKKSGTVTQ